MQRAILKIAVLMSVMGTGGYTLYKVNDKLTVQTDKGEDPQKWAAVGDGATTGETLDGQLLVNGELGASSAQLESADPGLAPPDQDEPDRRLSRSFATFSEPSSFDTHAHPEVASGHNHDDSTISEPADDAGAMALFGGPSAEDQADGIEVESAGDDSGGNPFLSFADNSTPESAPPAQDEPLTFDGPGLATDPSVETAQAATDEPQPEITLAAAPPAARTRATPTLTFAAGPDEPTGEAAAIDVVTPGAAEETEPAPAESANDATDPFGAGAPGLTLDAAPADLGADTTAMPVLEFGPQSDPAESEPVLPEQPTEPDAAEQPAFSGFGPLDTSVPESPAESEVDRPESRDVEPNRLPPIDDEMPAAKTPLRTREFAPLQPAPRAEPFTKIIPNPLPGQPAAGDARSELVGDATTDGAVTGPQQPELTIQKVAPTNAAVGDPLVYAIKVKNVGNSTAHDVIVEDRIPRGTNLEGTIPQAELTDRKLVWQLGEIEPGSEKMIRIKVIPTEAGEIGSVATVRFVAEVAATTKITTPSLTMDVQGPSEVAVGEQATFHFQIANNGDGEARNVYIRNLLPDGFEHAGGHDIEYDVGALRPGETREVDLAVKAVGEGVLKLTSHLNTGTTTRAQTEAAVKVIKSRLLIERHGPKRRFVGRPAEYSTTVSNRSSAVLKNVSVIEQLPAGMELAAVPDGGHWDKQRRTITWRIPQLGPAEQTALKTSVIASQQNVMQWLVQASDAAGNSARLTSSLEVAGFASLAVDLEHNGRPVGIGEQVALQLKVKNRGTGSAAGVVATFEIPPHLEFNSADGPVEYQPEGNKVQFAALDELAANGEQTYQIVLTAREPGNTAVTAQLSTADGAQPLQHSEPVTIYGDGP